jgi:hypothetical protein
MLVLCGRRSATIAGYGELLNGNFDLNFASTHCIYKGNCRYRFRVIVFSRFQQDRSQ